MRRLDHREPLLGEAAHNLDGGDGGEAIRARVMRGAGEHRWRSAVNLILSEGAGVVEAVIVDGHCGLSWCVRRRIGSAAETVVQ
jgi:hypothetical protein